MPRAPRKPAGDRDGSITRALTAWFERAARPLPWRTDIATATPRPRDPYHNLVAELMAQQTQLSRVVPAFEKFTVRFPTVADLAAADEADVLALWSGLGYYRRARNLHAAAQAVMTDHGGTVPSTAERLVSLPGVGRYTAGSLASIVFGERTPLVDGNVTRVLLRVEERVDLTDPKGAATFAWARAAELVGHAAKPGRFNEGLMELGATICTPPPSLPDCPNCPLNRWCKAFADGMQDRIPAPKKVKDTPTVYCATLVARDKTGRFMLEQRPATGMWSNMWQCPTLESDTPIKPSDLRVFAQMRSLDPASLAKVGSLTRQTTHRTMAFDVYTATPVPCRRKQATVRWVARSDLGTVGISNAQLTVIRLATGSD
ncbi:MAG: NUDIX domain-containing protein [Phycisphaerales bacterium]|nr:NUDIX domain-containing protein [Phycisphaerales bacterium]